METFKGISKKRLTELLNNIKNVRIGILGDICLDVYWLADMKKSELSRETPHFPLPVVEERMSPGGGGNAAANLAALQPAKIWVISVTGEDWRGTELLKLLSDAGIDTQYILHRPEFITNAYCKPLRSGISKTIYEDPRLDFTNFKPIDKSVEDAIIDSLNTLAPQIDALCVSDQMAYGVVTERVREHLIKLAAEGLTIIVDSRDRIGEYRNVILKPNEVEGSRATGIEIADNIVRYAEIAQILSREKNNEVLMTIGEHGSLYAFKENITHIPAHPVTGEIDIVGAGDTFLSGFSLGLAAGAARTEAAYIAGLCSGVTIQKIGTTGTATSEEVLVWYDTANKM